MTVERRGGSSAFEYPMKNERSIFIDKRARQAYHNIDWVYKDASLIPKFLHEALHPNPVPPAQEGEKRGRREERLLSVLYALQIKESKHNMVPTVTNLKALFEELISRETVQLPNETENEVKRMFMSYPDNPTIIQQYMMEQDIEEIQDILKSRIKGGMFADCRDRVIYAITDTILHDNHRDGNGRKIVMLVPKTDDYAQGERLVQALNKHLPQNDQLIVTPTNNDIIPGLRSVPFSMRIEKRTVLTKKEQCIANDLFTFKDQVDYSIDIDGKVELAMQFGSFDALEKDKNEGKLLPRSSQSTFGLKKTLEVLKTIETFQDETKPRRNYMRQALGKKEPTYSANVALYSFISSFDSQRNDEMARWINISSPEQIAKVASQVKEFFSIIQKEPVKKELVNALADGIYESDQALVDLNSLIAKLYNEKYSVGSKRSHVAELRSLPIVEAATRVFLTEQCRNLSEEIKQELHTKRVIRRITHAVYNEEGNDDGREYAELSGYPRTPKNLIGPAEPIKPIEMNMAAVDQNNSINLLNMMNDPEGTINTLLKTNTISQLKDLFVYSGLELWSQTADQSPDIRAKSIKYINTNKVLQAKDRKRSMYINYDIIIPPRIKKDRKTEQLYAHPKSSMDILIPIEFVPPEKTEGGVFWIKSGENTVGTLYADEII